MTPCALCGRPCVPMADYDIPVCHRCDDAHELRALDRQARTLPAWAARLPFSYRRGPGDPADIAALVAAFDSKPGRRSEMKP